ncbi:transglycosylase SLT domain-containing protein [Myxococcus sp. K15C18031901]|uniref:transglycosylase SLT domain-containing protein n=1 Tax=Myxococcus dinghuensis TaxID=2906761 RepID=UPI0020A7A72F|nr:peptidoglycan-binding protein [Myxococcus dinghuensis]MCP3103132.1 transglycosylase SLT domain-containing protein [Myxococcus dinghuensis]
MSNNLSVRTSSLARTQTISNDAGTKDLNAILSRYKPTGASQRTASQDGLTAGVNASTKMAQTDAARLKKYAAEFEAAGKKYDLPPALLAAIASRESRAGAALDSRGLGDNGNGFGLMQVDKRYHKPEGGPYSANHIDQAAGILKGFLNDVKKAHPDWSPEQQLRGAVAAYNSGPKNVRTIQNMDVGTTGNDYSNDVWARAQALAKDFGGTTTNTDLPGSVTKPGNTQTNTVKPAALPRFNGKYTAAPSLSDVKAGKADLHIGHQGAAVRELQKKLGVEADGFFGPKTRAAVQKYQLEHGLKPPPGKEGFAGADMLKKLGITNKPATKPTGDSFETTNTKPKPGTTQTQTDNTTNKPGAVLGNGVTIDTNNPTLKKLATSRLDNGPTGYCVQTTLNNMRRLGIPNTPSATGNDPNNPRGGMAQMLRNGWESIPFPGSKQKAIKSPYGNATANVVTADQYRQLVKEGKVPDGAIIFQTRHGWDYSGGSKGNDMGVVRNNGKTTHNYADMSSIIYSDCKEVAILVPKDAIKRD